MKVRTNGIFRGLSFYTVILDGMGNIRNKPMILVWPVEQKTKKKHTNILMGDSYMYCVSERDLFPFAPLFRQVWCIMLTSHLRLVEW